MRTDADIKLSEASEAVTTAYARLLEAQHPQTQGSRDYTELWTMKIRKATNLLNEVRDLLK